MHLEINNKNFLYKMGVPLLEMTEEERLGVLTNYRMTLNCQYRIVK